MNTKLITLTLLITCHSLYFCDIDAVEVPKKGLNETCKIVQLECLKPPDIDDDEEYFVLDSSEECASERIDECDDSMQLQCHHGTCQIICHPDYQIFDSLTKKCLGKAGSVCVNDSYCVENASCLLKYCSCNPGYKIEGGLCFEASNYGEACHSEKICDMKSGIGCVDGKCECAYGPQNQWYDPVKQKCISFPGGKCAADYLCSNNSLCTNSNPLISVLETSHADIWDSRSLELRCKCKRGFATSKDNTTCKGDFGSRCIDNQSCKDSLKCVDGRCHCLSPSYQIYDTRLSQCISLIGTTCKDSDSASLICIQNSECINGICRCKSGYSSTPNRTCLPDYHQKCWPNQCNTFRGLACIGGVCDCRDSIHKYDSKLQSCNLLLNKHTAEQNLEIWNASHSQLSIPSTTSTAFTLMKSRLPILYYIYISVNLMVLDLF